MCVTIDKEQVVAGFVNRHEDGMEFTMEDIDAYELSLWNAGCGIIRVNYTRQEIINYLNSCDGMCLRRVLIGTKWRIDKSLLSDKMTPAEHQFFNGNKHLAKSFDLFCKLQVDIKTPRGILDAMGYRYLYA